MMTKQQVKLDDQLQQFMNQRSPAEIEALLEAEPLKDILQEPDLAPASCSPAPAVPQVYAAAAGPPESSGDPAPAPAPAPEPEPASSAAASVSADTSTPLLSPPALPRRSKAGERIVSNSDEEGDSPATVQAEEPKKKRVRRGGKHHKHHKAAAPAAAAAAQVAAAPATAAAAQTLEAQAQSAPALVIPAGASSLTLTLSAGASGPATVVALPVRLEGTLEAEAEAEGKEGSQWQEAQPARRRRHSPPSQAASSGSSSSSPLSRSVFLFQGPALQRLLQETVRGVAADLGVPADPEIVAKYASPTGPFFAQAAHACALTVE